MTRVNSSQDLTLTHIVGSSRLTHYTSLEPENYMPCLGLSNRDRSGLPPLTSPSNKLPGTFPRISRFRNKNHLEAHTVIPLALWFIVCLEMDRAPTASHSILPHSSSGHLSSTEEFRGVLLHSQS